MISKDKSLYFDCLDFTPVVSAEEMPSEVNKKNTPVHRSSRGGKGSWPRCVFVPLIFKKENA
jgi:hypothetical protein